MDPLTQVKSLPNGLLITAQVSQTNRDIKTAECVIAGELAALDKDCFGVVEPAEAINP